MKHIRGKFDSYISSSESNMRRSDIKQNRGKKIGQLSKFFEEKLKRPTNSQFSPEYGFRCGRHEQNEQLTAAVKKNVQLP